MSAFFLTMSLIKLEDERGIMSFSDLWDLGFGSVSSSTVLKLCENPGDCSRIIPIVLLANTPQVIASLAYFFYNNTLTIMLLTAEFNNYATKRKPLRVSWPKGLQRSTYYLSLPYRYSIPLLINHVILHWLVSQSLFFVEIILFDTDENQTSEKLIACGHSPIAIIFTMILCTSMLLVLLSLRYSRFKSNMPLAGSCSEAISAACHPPPGGADALKAVMWGEIPTSKVIRTDINVDTSSLLHDLETTDRTVSRLNSKDLDSDEGIQDDNQGRVNQSLAYSSDQNTCSDEGDAENIIQTVSTPSTRAGGANEGGVSTTQGQDNDPHLLGEEDGPGHCSFSSLEVITPSAGKVYL